jgi:hypothetical protein
MAADPGTPLLSAALRHFAGPTEPAFLPGVHQPRDPDGSALEFDAPNELAIKAQQALASGQTSPAEIAAFVAEHFGPDYVPASRPSN